MDNVLKIIEHNISILSDKSERVRGITREMYREVALAAENSHEISSPYDLMCIFESIHGKNFCGTDSRRLAAYCAEISCVCGDRFGSFPVLCTSSKSFAGIAYMQNSYSDAAYRKFSARFKKASAIYFPGFREVCEEVYYGRSTHAIIPVYTSKDGQLLSFRKLIAKYELKIVCECSVEMNDDSVMRFALLHKGLVTPSGTAHLDLSVILPDHIGSGDFMSAIEALGGRILMINSNPLEYSDDKYNLSVQVDVSATDLNALYLFLEGAQISYEIMGLFDVLDDHN